MLGRIVLSVGFYAHSPEANHAETVVWEFSRVCGTFHERRDWHPNQHPEALIERIVKFSCAPGDLVVDMFAGTGTVNRVCRRLGIDCIGIEISEEYCRRINHEPNQISHRESIKKVKNE